VNPTIIERKERFARKMAGKLPRTVRSHDRLPPGQHLTTGFPVLDLGIQPEIPLSEWRLKVGGLVENPKTFSWEEFNALPQFEDVSDFHCVTTWSKYDVRWSGVAFFTLTDIVRPRPEAKYVRFGSYDDYTTNVRIEDVMDDDVLVASKCDGKPLPREHGGPVRIVIPKLYAWKSAKFVRSIEFSAGDKPGFWEVRGYSNTADPWTEDRFSGGQAPATFDAA
jgi:DMSO/TMAO reductase YedYZ molybdopterin-dependent catalytic subunit